MPDQSNRKRHVLKDGQFQEAPDSEIDYELTSPTKFGGSHLNLIPLQSSMQGTRGFYGARFANQALPVVGAEAPWVQNLDPEDPEGRSFDDKMGEFAGAIKAENDGVVQHLDPDKLQVQYEDGKVKDHELYNHQPFNRKTEVQHIPLVKIGDKFKKGQVLARSNYTDDKGTLAMGLNARVGLVAYKGHSMDDALVISESFAKRLRASSLYGHDLDYKRGVKGGKAHYTGIFPHKFVNDQLHKLDDEGVVKPGQILQPGDPVILATRPRVISSASSQLGLLSKHMRNARSDAAVLWDHETPGKVVDVHKLRSGVKVNVSTDFPMEPGSKAVFRSGQKGVISEIIPDERMPRTADGKPLEVLLNQLGIPSRVNSSLIYELLLGKVAAKTGHTYRVPSFNQPGEKWFDQVRAELDKAGLSDTEEVFDPASGKKLENPITVGNGYILALHHTGASKYSARGQGAYDNDQQPVHGGGEGGKSKRLSGLENNGLLSSGAYNVLREGATLRGTKNDDFWRQLRQGHEPREPGHPFIWDKFKAMLSGSGHLMRHMPNGKDRLQFFTDKDLDQHRPLEVKTGDIVDLGTMEPVKNGLFDPALTGGASWGKITLPHPIPNPAAETAILRLLGLTEKQYRDVIAGTAELPPEVRGQMKRKSHPLAVTSS